MRTCGKCMKMTKTHRLIDVELFAYLAKSRLRATAILVAAPLAQIVAICCNTLFLHPISFHIISYHVAPTTA